MQPRGRREEERKEKEQEEKQKKAYISIRKHQNRNA
jgi:hypothetical protein